MKTRKIPLWHRVAASKRISEDVLSHSSHGRADIWVAELPALAVQGCTLQSWEIWLAHSIQWLHGRPTSMTPASVSRVVSCLSVLPSCRSLRHSEYSHAEGTQSPWGTFFFKIMSSEQCGCNLFLLFGLTEYMPLFTAAPQELTEPVLSILIYSTGAGGECSEGSHDLTAGDTQPTCSLAST